MKYEVYMTVMLKGSRGSGRLFVVEKDSEQEAQESARKLDEHVESQIYRDQTSPKIIIVNTGGFKLRVNSYEFAGHAIEVVPSGKIVSTSQGLYQNPSKELGRGTD